MSDAPFVSIKNSKLKPKNYISFCRAHFRDGKLLIAQRQTLPIWVDFGNSWRQARGRRLSNVSSAEIRKDTNRLFREWGVYDDHPCIRKKTVLLKILHLPPGSVNAAIECAAVRWASPSELDQHEFPPPMGNCSRN